MELEGRYPAPAGGLISLRAVMRGDQRGVAFDRVLVASDSGEIMSMGGVVPIVLNPGADRDRIQIYADQPMQLEARTRPNASFWGWLSESAGLEVRDPEVRLVLGGTWSAPRGELHAEAAAFSRKIESGKFSVENIRLDLELEPKQIRLRQLELLLEKQGVSARGQLPMDKTRWRNLVRNGRFPDWREASASVVMSRAKLAPFATYVPEFLSPEGEISIDLELRPGAQLNGAVVLEGAATRPLSDLGPLREVRGIVRLAGRTARIESLSALVGGEPVQLAGQIELPLEKWPLDDLPQFNLSIKGSELPLARRPGLIVRSDFELGLLHTNKQPILERKSNWLRRNRWLRTMDGVRSIRMRLNQSTSSMFRCGRMTWMPPNAQAFWRIQVVEFVMRAQIVLALLLSTTTVWGAEPASWDISGYGFWGNRELKRIVGLLEEGREKPQFYDAAFIEDAVFLMLSKLIEDGYLRPAITARLSLPQGTFAVYRGENSVRGYQQGEAAPRNAAGKVIGAETYLLANLELEQALTPTWSIVWFLDSVGFAQALADYPLEEQLHSIGMGLRWKTIIGPVRVEYGYNLNRRRHDPVGTLHFSLGFPF